MDYRRLKPHRVASALRRRVVERPAVRDLVVEEFAKLYHHDPTRTWLDTHWLGHRIWKLPADMWVYQELIYRLRPDLIIETGTAEGGSAFYMASLMDLIDHGRIVTIDIDDFAGRPKHDRITYVRGSSTDRAVVDPILAEAREVSTVMVILDADHSRDHVYGELQLLADAVTVGSYLIVEDGNVNGHPVLPQYGPGPTEALERWLPANQHRFEVDRGCEKYFHTFNPGGYLRRIR